MTCRLRYSNRVVSSWISIACCSLPQLPELSHTLPCCSFPQLLWDGLSSFHTWDTVTGFGYLSCCSLQQLLDSAFVSEFILVIAVLLSDECNTSITTSHKSRAGIPPIHKPASSDWVLGFCRTVRHWCLLLAHPTYGNKCSTSNDT